MTNSTAVRRDADALPSCLDPRDGLERAIAGTDSTQDWIHAVARRHGIAYTDGPPDESADAVSRLVDADAQLDDTERLLTAIERAGDVTGREAVLLHGAYLRQRS